jgi:hypothetical protein
MPNETFNSTGNTGYQNLSNQTQSTDNYSGIIRELVSSSKDLLKSEIALAVAEIKEVSNKTSSDLVKLAIFGVIAMLSLPPFVAFLVIGLGELLGDRYWLSALIVSITFASVGGTLAYLTLKKIKEKDIDFSALKSSIRREKSVVQSSVERIKSAAKGESHGTVQLH